MILSAEARPLLDALSPVFTRPTFHRFVAPLSSAILTTGRRTVANILRTATPIARGHRTTYRRAFSSAEWSALRLACQLCRLVLALIPADQAAVLVGDDTVAGHPGREVYGKARHRDPVRSTHTHTAWRYGHKWVVLAVLVRFPGPTAPGRRRCRRACTAARRTTRCGGVPISTPARIMATPLRVILSWSPDRRFVLVGDSGYGTHEPARFVDRHRARLSLVSELRPEADLFEPPPPYPGEGRPPVKGPRRPKPREAVEAAELDPRTVARYGGGQREVGVIAGTGQWHEAGEGSVPIVWAFVRDQSGTHRDEYFFGTDVSMTAVAMIAAYRGCWNPETTFQEMRRHLGLETTRGRCRRTVLRAAPCLFGLYTVVALLYQSSPESKRSGRVEWPGEVGVTFSDALTSVRRWLWREWISPQAGGGGAVNQLPESLHQLLSYALAPAA